MNVESDIGAKFGQEPRNQAQIHEENRISKDWPEKIQNRPKKIQIQPETGQKAPTGQGNRQAASKVRIIIFQVQCVDK